MHAKTLCQTPPDTLFLGPVVSTAVRQTPSLRPNPNRATPRNLKRVAKELGERMTDEERHTRGDVTRGEGEGDVGARDLEVTCLGVSTLRSPVENG